MISCPTGLLASNEIVEADSSIIIEIVKNCKKFIP